MMRIVQLALVLTSAVFLAACGDATGTGSEGFGIAAPATGQITMTNSTSGDLISGVRFDNEGTTDISIDQVEFTLTDGQIIDEDFGFGVAAGEIITDSFNTSALQSVQSVSFRVTGSTEKLVVLESTDTGTVPAPQ